MKNFYSDRSLATMCRLICACLLMTVLIAPASAGESEKGSAAWDGFTLTEAPGDRIHALFSPYSYHYSRDPDHRHVWLVGTERERANGALAGAVLFSNSFGQPTIYAYPWGGIVKDVMGVDRLFVKWTAGILYGYRRPFEDKVPLNYQGFSPGFIPAVGWQFEGGQQFQVNLFGGAGFMLQFSAQIK